MAWHTKHVKTYKDTPTCSCPACMGLECLERPRYFAGQLLTEAELNSEQAYALAKNRLHNRYLHGPGVVCGLPVVCHPYDGWVTVKQGYAIDPCGNDIIVCEDHDFDVIKAIQQCRATYRRHTAYEPWRGEQTQQAPEVEENWCLTIAYEEKEARPTTALRPERKQSCGCCSGESYRCRCRCHAEPKTQTAYAYDTAQLRSGIGKTIAPCEPTRVVEGYRLEMIEAPLDVIQPSMESILDDTLLSKIKECVKTVTDFIGKRVATKDLNILAQAFFTTKTIGDDPQASGGANGKLAPEDLYQAFLKTRRAIFDLYVHNPLNVHCAVPDTFHQLVAQPPEKNPETGQGPTLAAYTEVVQDPLRRVAMLMGQYILDCICLTLLPPCAPDPCEDRLILACLTIRDNKIIRICNWSGRRHAGAFPSLYYWLSLAPIIPTIRWLIQNLCCFSVDEGSKTISAFDPAHGWREAIFAGNFAMPNVYAGKFKQLLEPFSSLGGVGKFFAPGDVNLATYVGQSAEETEKALVQENVTVIWRDVASADDAPALPNLLTFPFVSAGDAIVLHRADGKVVGFARVDALAALAETQVELAAMRTEMATLRDELQSLRQTIAPPEAEQQENTPPEDNAQEHSQ